jgi:hypothetical protein
MAKVRSSSVGHWRVMPALWTIAVVISAEAYARLQPREKLVDILRDCPVKGWQTDHDPGPARDLNFQ